MNSAAPSSRLFSSEAAYRMYLSGEQAREAELQECGAYFARLWEERAKQPMKTDLLSMMAHSEATRDMDPRNFLGNLILHHRRLKAPKQIIIKI